MIAMEGEKTQQKRATVTGATTPKKRNPERPLIGSGSTWKEEQLVLFNVDVNKEATDAKRLIPEKWFEYGSLEDYQSSNDTINT
jgi:hypothetical protein